jgi:hypothetical protein
MRILYHGSAYGNSGSRLRALQLLGHNVEQVQDPLPSTWRPIRAIEVRLYNGPATMKLNRIFLRQAMEFKPNLVWVEMGRSIYASTLRQIKNQFGSLLVNSYSDDFIDKHSRHYNRSIKLYDCIFDSTGEVNYPAYYKLGAKFVTKFLKGFDPETIFPVELTPEESQVYASDVTFIGHCEPSTIEVLAPVADVVEGIKIWGSGWNRYRLPKTLKRVVQYRRAMNEEFRKALCGAKIVIHYLSKWARDPYSSKSFEIPASGAFMLAERTQDHLALFEEDKEAVFFSSTEELLDKAKFYLSNDQMREKIAAAGRQRCLQSGYSNYNRMAEMMKLVARL